MRHMEEIVRRMLRQLADEVPGHRTVPNRMLRRARRRVALGVIGVALGVSALGGAVFAGLEAAQDPPAMQVPGAPPSDNVATVPEGRTPEGGIAFLSDRGQGAGYRIYVMNADGSDVTQVTSEQVFSSKLSWSPDGASLVVDVGLGEGAGDLLLVDVGSGATRSLFAEGPHLPGPPQGPAWSPDGTRIAYYSGDGRVAVVNVDSSDSDVLGSGLEPAWSPDGSQIAFHRGDGIYVMNADGSRVQELTDGSRDQNPVWSPDGSSIAFSRSTDSGTQVFVMTSDGGDVRQLTFEGGAAPSWSPDGSTIAFVNNIEGSPDVYVMSTDGSSVTRITSPVADDNAPAWRPIR